VATSPAGRRSCTFLAALAVTVAVTWPLPGSAAIPVLRGLVRAAGQPAREAVVWLDYDGPGPDAVRVAAVLDQRNMQFAPRVLAVRVGTAVRMPNSDRLFHNVFSFRDGKVFDLGLYPVGTSKSVTFDRAGVSRIFCNIHPAMAAYVVSVDSPLFAVTDSRGRFVIPGVPPGSHPWHVWRAGTPEASGTLVVAADAVEIDLP
jgi:plastocyanin